MFITKIIKETTKALLNNKKGNNLDIAFKHDNDSLIIVNTQKQIIDFNIKAKEIFPHLDYNIPMNKIFI